MNNFMQDFLIRNL